MTARVKSRRLAAWQVTALAAAGSAGGLALANWLARVGIGEPENPLRGEEGLYPWTEGNVHYTVRGRGEPLALIHGVYPGASSFEYRNIFEPLAERYRVFALDLLGFGLSARPATDYSPKLYIELIEDFLRQVVGAADQPAHIIASGLGATFAIHAAANRPNHISSLTLIEPTGFIAPAEKRDGLGLATQRALFRSPLVGEAIYNLATTRTALRLLLGASSYSDPAHVSDDILDHYYSMAHQPGARFVIADAFTGRLTAPVADVFPAVTTPSLLIWGRQDSSAPVALAHAFQELRPGTEVRLFPTGGTPQEEAPEAFLREVTTWMRAAARV